MIKILQEDLYMLEAHLERFTRLTVDTIQATKEWIDDDSFIIETRNGQLEWLQEYLEMRITTLLELIVYLDKQINIETPDKKFIISQLSRVYQYELKFCQEYLPIIINKLESF